MNNIIGIVDVGGVCSADSLHFSHCSRESFRDVVRQRTRRTVRIFFFLLLLLHLGFIAILQVRKIETWISEAMMLSVTHSFTILICNEL